jgi:hypothetical protein
MEELTCEVISLVCLAVSNIRYDGYLCGKKAECICTPWGQK